MTPLAADTRPPNEKPTVYRGVAALIGGALVVLLCVFGSIDLMVESGTKDLTAAAILMLVAVLAAIFGAYPAVFSWTDRLVVRNPFRTIELPWEAVTDLSARLSFVAHTENRRYTVWAIPVSLRERRRAERHRVRDLSQAQRAAKRGVSQDQFQSSRGRYSADPIANLSFADQAIAEMNAKREAHVVKARLQAKVAQAQAAEAQSAQAQAAQAGVASGADATDAAPFVEVVAPAEAGTVRWTWPSFVLLGASVVFLIVAVSLPR